jgi:diguanylate cyclase (GGDEF)-like protein
MTPIELIPDNGPDQELVRKLQEAQQCLDQLIRGGQWLVWSSLVTGILDGPTPLTWSFGRDISQVMPEWFDVDREDGENLSTVLERARLEEDTQECNKTCHRAMRSGASGYTQMFRVRLRDGRISWVEETAAIHVIDEETWRHVSVCIDVTDHKEFEARLKALQDNLVVKQAELLAQNEELQALRDTLEKDKLALAEANARLESLATTDGLTGIKNHRSFQEELDKQWRLATRYRRQLSLVVIDIDHFKPYNDTFGHPAGDEVLKSVGQILTSTARRTDFVARYGGEEFVAILPQTDAEGAMALAERIRAGIEAFAWGSLGVTASVGVSTRCDRHLDAQSLFAEADKALYSAKTEGRNCVRGCSHAEAQQAA